MKHLDTILGRISLSLVIVVSIASQVQAQGLKNELPKIGKPMPDFMLDNIHHFKSTKASLKDFNGKWLILDFWISGCLPCIRSWPKMNKIQQTFKDQLLVVLVGSADKDEKKENWNNLSALISLHDRMREKQNLNLVAAYDRGILYQRFGKFSFPQMYIIDPQGILRYITDGRDIDEEKIQMLLEGKQPNFYPKDSELASWEPENIIKFDSTILYSSLITKFGYERYGLGPIDIGVKEPDLMTFPGYYCTGASLKHLYNIAYVGTHVWGQEDSTYNDWYRFPYLELKDTSSFIYDKKGGIAGRYNYMVKLPNNQLSKGNLMRIMQGDLKNYFGYLVTIEKRKMPVWKLVAKPGAESLLKTKGGNPYYRDEGTSGGPAGFMMMNIFASNIVYTIARFQKDGVFIPYIDETGIFTQFNVDMQMNCDMSDREQVRRELKKYNLDLVKGEKEYKVIVIRDTEPLKANSGQVLHKN
jgi:peroxiredoxin